MRTYPLILLIGALLVGCGSAANPEVTTAPSDSALSSSAAPTTEASSPAAPPTLKNPQTFRRGGVTLDVPQGWIDVTKQSADATLLTLAHLGDDDVPHYIVIRRPAQTRALDASLDAFEARAARRGDSRITRHPELTIAGLASGHVSSVSGEKGKNSRTDVYILGETGPRTVIEFVTNRWMTGERRAKLIEPVLASLVLG